MFHSAFPSIQKAKSQLALVAISLVILALLGTSVRAWLVKGFTSKALTTEHYAPAASQGRSRSNLEAEIITLSPNGFYPRQITRRPGRFLLMVDNYSEQETVMLHLDRVEGERLREAPVPHDKRDWSDVLELPPGEYTLTEAGHPEWSCRISIR